MTATIEWHAKQMRDALWVMVRRRVPARDAEDVVQSILAEALASPHRPVEPESARRWIWGMARNKIADYYRRARRESFGDGMPLLVAPSDEPVHDLLDWVATELPSGIDDRRTLEWMLRESEGEKLEEIARSEALPATQVRQRVSRLRRHFRERWAMYAALLGVTTLVAMWLWQREGASQPETWTPTMQIAPDHVATIERARTLRDEARGLCARSQWSECLGRLDAARSLDPLGDDAIDVRTLREAAMRGRDHDAQNAPREPGMPWRSSGPRDAMFDRQRGRDANTHRSAFAAIGAPGGLGDGSAIVSPFGGLTESAGDDATPLGITTGGSMADDFGAAGLGASGSGWTGTSSIASSRPRHVRRRAPISRSSSAP